MLAHPVLTSVLYISHSSLKISYLLSNQQGFGFFSFLDGIHRLEHLFLTIDFQKDLSEAEKYSSQTGIINILGDTYFGDMYTESKSSSDPTEFGYHYSFEKPSTFLGKNDINIANFEAVFSLENQSPLKDKKPFVLKANAIPI